MSSTPEQERAIHAQGNVLVVAGAGTGKTRTLVECCLARICDPVAPASLDEILMVTFTEAAAAELRGRLREALEARAQSRPEDDGLASQLALLDAARITTLHSFCFQLVREHFHELALDPEAAVMPEDQSLLLAGEVLDRLLARYYEGADAESGRVRALLANHGRDGDESIRDLVVRIHAYGQTLGDPEAWFDQQFRALDDPNARRWREWLPRAFDEWKLHWSAALASETAGNPNARDAVALLAGAPAHPDREKMTALLKEAGELGEHWPAGRKQECERPLKEFLDEAAFLHSLAEWGPDGRDPLLTDWNWVREPMRTLLELSHTFGREFAAAKRDSAALDFHDLEQFALRLLWNAETRTPTATARRWQERLRFIFVDEYQDINEAQDRILESLGREGAAANRFLVGDVKQSIYRFRLANPRIFQRYAGAWAGAVPGQTVVGLTGNFRSHAGILDFVNDLFSLLMRERVGGVEYDQAQWLRCGNPDQRPQFSRRQDEPPRVELHLVAADKSSEPEDRESEDEEMLDLSGTEKEALLVAQRLRRLRDDGQTVWDRERAAYRPVEWRDMVVLLRSPRGKAEAYARSFDLQGVPLVVARGGFYESREIADVLSLLRMLDNPLQDLPLLAVLRSPFVGLTLDELAEIRMTQPRGYFWTALQRASNQGPKDPRGAVPGAEEDLGGPPREKLSRFLSLSARWRRMLQRASLSECVETILDESGYEAWARAEPRGDQREANLRRLLTLTRHFDQFQRQGLYRFLRFVETQCTLEIEAEPAVIGTRDAVRLMSIHQAKGLEFPVVTLADLGKLFNLSDLKGPVILDEELGLCPQVQPPSVRQRYPSLPYWLARRNQRRETLGEELRLLYVAATRAGDRLILVGTNRKKADPHVLPGTRELPFSEIVSARSSLEWISHWLAATSEEKRHGLVGLMTHRAEQIRVQPTGAAAPAPNPAQLARCPIDRDGWDKVLRRVNWGYPFRAETTEPAKASVSMLRRRWRDEMDDEAASWFSQLRRAGAAVGLAPAEVGTVHHAFLKVVDLDALIDRRALAREAERLVQAGWLTPGEIAALDLEAIEAFGRSGFGARLRAHREHARRELPFTMRLSAGDLDTAGLAPALTIAEDEFLVVQGVADLAVILPAEIWLLDYKTDRFPPRQLDEVVRAYTPQLKLYALALGRIYRRPVVERWLHFFALRRTVAV